VRSEDYRPFERAAPDAAGGASENYTYFERRSGKR